MKTLPALPLVLLAALCAAQQGPSSDLQQRADRASGKQCAQLSMQAARQSLENADHLFSTGDAKDAHSAIDSSLHYARRSVDCTLMVHKHEKAAEIDIRELIRRMKQVRQTLDSEDQPHLAKGLAELNKQRDRLLRAIFGPAASARQKTP